MSRRKLGLRLSPANPLSHPYIIPCFKHHSSNIIKQCHLQFCVPLFTLPAGDSIRTPMVKGGECTISVNMVHKNHNNGKGKQKAIKPNKTTTFKKRNNKVELSPSHALNFGTFVRIVLRKQIIVRKGQYQHRDYHRRLKNRVW